MMIIIIIIIIIIIVTVRLRTAREAWVETQSQMAKSGAMEVLIKLYRVV